MALRFKKQYENQTIVLADGTLINKNTIWKPSIQAKLKGSGYAYMLEDRPEAVAVYAEPAEEIKEPETETAPETPKKTASKKTRKK